MKRTDSRDKRPAQIAFGATVSFLRASLFMLVGLFLIVVPPGLLKEVPSEAGPRGELIIAGVLLFVVAFGDIGLALAVMFRAAEGNPALAWVALACMAGFIASQQAAVSPTTWLLISELVPPQVRGVGMGLAGLALWVMNWVVAQFFLPLVDATSATFTFCLFAVFGVVASVFVARRVPETMGRSLDDVAAEMRQRFGAGQKNV